MKIQHLLMFSILVVLSTSCGKSNQVSDGGPSSPGNPTSPVLPGPVAGGPSASEIAYINTLKSQQSCNRLPDRVYHITGQGQASGSKTTLPGQLVQGQSPGNPSKYYVGIEGANKHIMVVIKKTSGSQVAGYDVVLSLCQYSAGGVPYLSPQRGITGAVFPNGITLDDDTNCGVGNVDAAINGVLQLAPISAPASFGTPWFGGGTGQAGATTGNINYPAVNWPINFAKGCN